MFALYPIYVLMSLAFTGLTMLLAPALALLVDPQGNLPAWLSWFQTFDNTCFAGRQAYGWTGSDWWVSTRWLWRNPGYTFDMNVLGISFVASQWTVKHWDGSLFFATCACGAFNLEFAYGNFRLKFGWKAWNHFDPTTKTFVPGQWATFPKIPVTFSIMV